jgi:nucleoporin POM152
METATPGVVEYLFTELADNLYDYDKRKHQPLALQQRVNKKPSAAFAVPGKTYKYCKDEQVDEVIPLALEGVPPFYLELAIKHHRHAEPEVVRVPGIDAARYDFRVPHRLLALGSHSISVRKVRDGHGCQRKYDAHAPTVFVSVADAPAIAPLEAQAHYCVGDWIAFTLSGTPPFHVYYTFQGVERRASAASTSFRRIAESPGEFTITAVADQASDCKAKTHITKIIHPLPTVKISRGRETSVDIHEGGTAEILFEFTGTPPFEFT